MIFAKAKSIYCPGGKANTVIQYIHTSVWCARACSYQCRVCATTHTHEHTHGTRSRIDGRRSPRTIDVHARVGRPYAPAAASRTPACTREPMLACSHAWPGLPYSLLSLSRLELEGARCRAGGDSALFSRRENRGLVGSSGSRPFSLSLLLSRTPSALRDEGRRCSASSPEALSHTANHVSLDRVERVRRERGALSFSLVQSSPMTYRAWADAYSILVVAELPKSPFRVPIRAPPPLAQSCRAVFTSRELVFEKHGPRLFGVALAPPSRC